MDSNYGEDPQALPSTTTPDPSASEETGEGKTFLVPKDVCPGMKPGDALNARIVAVHGEEYSCEYVPDEASEDEGTPPEPEPGMDSATGPAGGGDSMYS